MRMLSRRPRRSRRVQTADVVADVVTAARRGDLQLTGGQRRTLDLLAGVDDVYLHGPPGRGKTLLVDAAVPALDAGRWHLHEFMAGLHEQIGVAGGVDAALSRLIADHAVVCLDEFTVHDPADGVFLDRVLRSLHDRGVRMIATSNRAPAALMPNPLFHAAFEPTITLIEEMFAVVDLDDGHDLRTEPHERHGFAAGSWGRDDEAHPPNGERAIAPGSQRLRLAGESTGEVWFTFTDLCEQPAHVSDYLWLAERYPLWHIAMQTQARATADAMARWAALLDVAYDRDVVVVVSAPYRREEFAAQLAAALPDAARTISRMSAWASEPPGRLR